MANGMISTPPRRLGWQTLNTTDGEGSATSIHFVPFEQLIHAVDFEVSCVCQPNVSYIRLATGRTVPYAHHTPLDVRYYGGEDEWVISDDDDDEGPEPDNETV